MNELIKITETNGKKAVSAKELYNKLGFDASQWARWFRKNIKNNQFAIENEDYTQLDIMSRTVDFALSVDFAKKLSMLARTETGEKIRQYFVDVEKQSLKPVYSIPQSYAEALEFAAKQQRMIESNTKELARLRPKAEFVERSMESEELTEMSTAVKILKFPLGRNKFFELLRKAGVFFKNRNEPLQQYIEMGYFEMKQKVIKRKSHPNLVVNIVFLTQKGMIRMSGWLSQRGFFDKDRVELYLLKK